MTASTLTQLPLMAGSALLGSVGRAGSWTFARYMRAPLASTGVLAMVTMTALAGSNALYFQTAEHPSPFFMPERTAVAPMPAPLPDRQNEVAPSRVATPAPAVVATPAETTGSVTPAVQSIPDAPVGNARMFALQKKLSELGLFTGKIDGYYGPQTAASIRAFESRNNLPLTGSHDSPVIDSILSSDAAGRLTAPMQAVEKPQAALPAPAPVVVTQPAPVQLAATAPMKIPTGSSSQTLPPVEQALDDVAIATANTIDSIIAAMDGSRSGSGQTGSSPTPPATLPSISPVQPKPQPIRQVTVVKPATTTAVNVPPATDAELVAQIQRGLASLGFFRAPIDGKPGPETARAIREFESFHRYKVTGLVQPDLVQLLKAEGASI